GLDVHDNRVLRPAIDRIVEIIGPELDDELAFDAGAETMEEAGLDAGLVPQGRGARVLRQVGLIHILIAVARVGPELALEEALMGSLIAGRRSLLRIVIGALGERCRTESHRRANEP